MKHLFSAPPNLAFFDCAGIRLMLGLPESDDATNHASVLYFTVPDIHEAFDTLSRREVTFEQGPHVIAQLGPNDLWMAFFRDSEGNLLSIMSEAPHRGVRFG
jgi:methylmalonyl-CoA/ethylmalonyl-CoA epimerase